jgi:hypothetical protein
VARHALGYFLALGSLAILAASLSVSPLEGHEQPTQPSKKLQASEGADGTTPAPPGKKPWLRLPSVLVDASWRIDGFIYSLQLGVSALYRGALTVGVSTINVLDYNLTDVVQFFTMGKKARGV